MGLRLPDSESTKLHLSHPTKDECVTIWTNTSASWKDSLTQPLFVKESLYLTTVPLAKDGGMTMWVLVDKTLPEDQRTILCSCESFYKRSLISDSRGNVTDAFVHGIASVFCPPAHRSRGYAARMMRELARELYYWQSGHIKCVGSILYSDIGKLYYAKLGWDPNPTNSYLVFRPVKISNQFMPVQIMKQDIRDLCERDEAMIQKMMAAPEEKIRTRLSVVPDLDHMLWHIYKEEFACGILFGKAPPAKGAILGTPGSQVWALWTHRYYDHPDSETHSNTLYILRLVIENPCSDKGNRRSPEHIKQIDHLKAIIQAAQAEAEQWKLDRVKLWDPIPAVQEMIHQTGLEHLVVEREEDSIASGLWYDEHGEKSVAPYWVNTEYYAWC